MAHDDDALRDRVRMLIDKGGVTQADLAEAVGIDASKMSKSLAGGRRFSTYELAAIAEYFETTVDYLLTGREAPVYGLAARSDSHKSDAWETAVERTKQLDEVDAALDELDVPPALTVARWEQPRLSGKAIEDGPALAEAAHALLDVPAFREDMASAIEAAFGIHVAAEQLGSDFDGLSWKRENFRLILINTDVAWSRQRFTIAHELGHHLAGDVDNQGLVTDSNVMRTEHKIAEMRANAFAAALLMPANEIEKELECRAPGTECFSRLVGKFRVSADALAWRLKGLGFIDADERYRLSQIQATQAAHQGGWTDLYLEMIQHQGRERLPGALAVRALKAFAQGESGARWPAAVLKCDPDLLHDALDGASSAEPADDREPVFVP